MLNTLLAKDEAMAQSDFDCQESSILSFTGPFCVSGPQNVHNDQFIFFSKGQFSICKNSFQLGM